MSLALASTGDDILASRCKVAMPVAPFLGQYHTIEKAKKDAGSIWPIDRRQRKDAPDFLCDSSDVLSNRALAKGV
jgi:hypothetical protein